MTATPSKNSSGRLFVLALLAVGILCGAATWWNYKRFHPSTQDARLTKSDPPTVLAFFSRAGFATDRTYLATVTFHGKKEKFAGETQGWKDAGNGKMAVEIILTDTPEVPPKTPCAVTLDLEIKSTSD